MILSKTPGFFNICWPYFFTNIIPDPEEYDLVSILWVEGGPDDAGWTLRFLGPKQLIFQFLFLKICIENILNYE